MKVLHVQAFGKLRMQYGGIAVTSFPTRHTEELLGFLLLNQQTAHAREKLVHLLWPSGDLDKGRGRLSTALWHLRRLFGKMGLASESFLQTTRNWVALVPEESLQLDVDCFERYLAQAQLAADEREREQHLRTAVTLYVGELYEGVYSDWCLIERERLARLRLRALGQLITSCIRRNAYQEAIDLGRPILQEDPLREEVHRALMRCYWQMGQRACAVKQFRDCVDHLRRELHILPMPETITLYRQIVENRLEERSLLVPTADTRQTKLQVAFAEFLEAGNKLNTLIDNAR